MHETITDEWGGGGALAVACLSVVLCGCPTYEDSYSGTFREADVDPVTASRAIELDLFRYGDNVSAILRFYEPDVRDRDPFAQESFCTWTEGGSFNKADRTFELPIERGSRIPESRLSGELLSDDRIEVSVATEADGEPVVETRELERVPGDPEPGCDSVGTLFIKPLFTLRNSDNTMPQSRGYDIEHPVFSVQWVGVTRASDGDFLVNTNAQGPTRRLRERNFDDGGPNQAEPDRLKDSLSLEVPAPPENIWIESGETSYAIGHPVVIDDSDESDSFSWDPETEPIVASALQIGIPVEARNESWPGGAKPDYSGKALLFVRGSIQELGEGFRNGFFEDPTAIEEGEIPESHFYVVEILYYQNAGAIRRISLPKSSQEHEQNRDIPMQMTDRYLDDDAPALPRTPP